MVERGLTRCVFTSMQNTGYFSNFVYCAFGRPYGVVVPLEGQPTTISALIDGGQPWRRSFGENLVYTDWQRDNFFQAVKELVGPESPGKVGVEFDHLSLQQHK